MKKSRNRREQLKLKRGENNEGGEARKRRDGERKKE